MSTVDVNVKRPATSEVSVMPGMTGKAATNATVPAVADMLIEYVNGVSLMPLGNVRMTNSAPGHGHESSRATVWRTSRVLWPGVTFGNRFGKPTDSTETADTGPLRCRSFCSETWKLALVQFPVHDAPVPWCDASRNSRFDA